jgi:cohesin loading factor subunit SCC2
MIGSLAELIDIQELTDTIILQASSLGVGPFFVENISELQLSAIKLVTTVSFSWICLSQVEI